MADLNENKPGYKKTKVGWIPEEWGYELIEKYAVRGSGHTPDKKVPEYYNGGIKWVSLTDSNKLDKRYIKETEIEVSQEGIENSSAVLHNKGTVILSRDAGVGKSAILGENMAVSQHFMAWKCGSKLDNIYLYYYLQYQKPFFERMASGSTIKTIGLGFFKKYKIVHPPLPEQRQIATLLSTWDAAIDKLGQLIAKKQALKKGLMQQLLSGRVRFPEFVPAGGTKYKETKVGMVPEDWEVVTLDELGSTYSGLSGKSKKDFGEGARYVPYKNVFANSAIDTTYFDYVEINEGEKQNQVKYGDIFFTVSSETPEEVGMSSVLLENIGECYLNSFCFGFRLDDFEKTIPEYLRFSLRCFPTRKAIARLAQGATRYNLSKRNVMKIPIALPSKAEQERIARVLTGLYDEILKSEKTKRELEVQKKGLMQQLLTGAVRVKD
jgi:type I restriction enzyme S subunit